MRCADGSLYTGYTTDIEKRMLEHNGEGATAAKRAGGAKYTRGRRPVMLVYSEECDSRSAATKREYAIKQLTKNAKEALIAAGSNELVIPSFGCRSLLIGR